MIHYKARISIFTFIFRPTYWYVLFFEIRAEEKLAAWRLAVC